MEYHADDFGTGMRKTSLECSTEKQYLRFDVHCDALVNGARLGNG